jgi:hypothetical protein
MAWYREERKVLKSPPYTLARYSAYRGALIAPRIRTGRENTHVPHWPILQLHISHDLGDVGKGFGCTVHRDVLALVKLLYQIEEAYCAIRMPYPPP